MKKIVLALTAASALAAAAPALAQPYGGYDRQDYRGWTSINQRQDQLDRRIDVGLRNGQLTRYEAGRLRNEFYDIARLERRYRSNGLSGWERADLDRRFDALSAKIRWERRDNDRYGYGYGYRR